MGATAMQNLIAVELFDQALGSAPHQKVGLYVCENAPWEHRRYLSSGLGPLTRYVPSLSDLLLCVRASKG